MYSVSVSGRSCVFCFRRVHTSTHSLVLTCITAIYSISGSGRELLEAHPTSGYEYTVYHRGRKVVDLRGGTVRFLHLTMLNFVDFMRIVANQRNQSTTFNDILFGTYFGPQIVKFTLSQSDFTARIRNLREGNVFTHVCLAFCLTVHRGSPCDPAALFNLFNLLFCQIFPENCKNMKKLDRVRRVRNLPM